MALVKLGDRSIDRGCCFGQEDHFFFGNLSIVSIIDSGAKISKNYPFTPAVSVPFTPVCRFIPVCVFAGLVRSFAEGLK
jgi:hypothetical protein